MPSSNIKAAVDVALQKAAALFRTAMIQKGRDVKVPSGLDRATYVDTPKHESNRSYIDIIISTKPEDAPWAGAYEYGSGEHGEKGERYRIPREGGGSFVAFLTERWPKYKPPPHRDYHYFPYVMHPGVEARPYIQPTIKDTKEAIRKIFAKDFKLAILYGVPKVTVIE